MKTFRLVLAIAVTFIPTAGSRGTAQERSWNGESVLPMKTAKEIRFVDQVNGKQVSFPLSNIWPVAVRDERDGRLRVYDGIREGWVNKGDFVLERAARYHFDERLEADPKDAWACFMRGILWLRKEEPEKAIKRFDEYLLLFPTDVTAFYARGDARFDQKEYGKAIADYSEAIRLEPKFAPAFSGRGATRSARREYDKAAEDYAEAIRLEPRFSLPHFQRSLDLFLAKRAEAAAGFRTTIELEGWKGELTPYAVILGHLAARRAGDEPTAKRFLKDSVGKLDETWPYPAVRFVRGEITEAELLRRPVGTDRLTEVRFFLGLDHAIKGNKDEALAYFRWIKERGTGDFVLFSLAELERLEKEK
jgi:lipoprotein NlpI